MIFFWSDTHFNHGNIIEYSSRPYSNVEEMNFDLIRRWNLVVKPADTIYLVGDFGFHHASGVPLIDIFSQLAGHKHLVIGNHDKKNPKVLKLPWESQTPLVTVKAQGPIWQKMSAEVCHYPIESWANAHAGRIMIHGHSHGTLKRKIPHRFDVGVDVEWTPVPFEELWDFAARQAFSPADHHAN